LKYEAQLHLLQKLKQLQLCQLMLSSLQLLLRLLTPILVSMLSSLVQVQALINGKLTIESNYYYNCS
jgi:hypothetical protein